MTVWLTLLARVGCPFPHDLLEGEVIPVCCELCRF